MSLKYLRSLVAHCKQPRPRLGRSEKGRGSEERGSQPASAVWEGGPRTTGPAAWTVRTPNTGARRRARRGSIRAERRGPQQGGFEGWGHRGWILTSAPLPGHLGSPIALAFGIGGRARWRGWGQLGRERAARWATPACTSRRLTRSAPHRKKRTLTSTPRSPPPPRAAPTGAIRAEEMR